VSTSITPEEVQYIKNKEEEIKNIIKDKIICSDCNICPFLIYNEEKERCCALQTTIASVKGWK